MYVSSDIKLVQDMVARFPSFQDLYECHIENNGEILSHVIFWDIVQDVIKAYLEQGESVLDWQAVLDFLEGEMQIGDSGVRSVIVTSFLEALPFPGAPGHEIVEHLGSLMSEKFHEIRPSG
ncbi:hypothetical protein ACFQ07_33815 [Actinomadura adrarensis]|uniref:DUF7674 domain-containing protein n=1 Tax=Actinomadura adrarensis TaxID=1819600 RepID=A0ABW3CSP8_9ACTN